VATCVASRLINSGQSCISAKRFVVVESRLTTFERLFVLSMHEPRWGLKLGWISGTTSTAK
jgi:succinate-semialdehyde dehydrogenase/glutarate-semialdehyde dehydrogenase